MQCVCIAFLGTFLWNVFKGIYKIKSSVLFCLISSATHLSASSTARKPTNIFFVQHSLQLRFCTQQKILEKQKSRGHLLSWAVLIALIPEFRSPLERGPYRPGLSLRVRLPARQCFLNFRTEANFRLTRLFRLNLILYSFLEALF